MTVKFDVLFSSGLGKNRGGTKSALPSTGTTNPVAASRSVVAKGGAALDLVVATSLIHLGSLTLAPTLRKQRGRRREVSQGRRLPEKVRRRSRRTSALRL